jgi:hypothetical protein
MDHDPHAGWHLAWWIPMCFIVMWLTALLALPKAPSPEHSLAVPITSR